MKKKIVFNFSASFSGGGFKRLYAYAKWFNQNGGAWFLIHANCCALINEFPNNNFTIANQSRVQRLFNDCGYLDKIQKEIGTPDLYYSYGIPIYYKFGRVNWFHLSNVLPLGVKGVPLSLFDKAKLSYLGKRIRSSYRNVDIISAESNFSLSLIKPNHFINSFLSVNGSDDEILLQDKMLTEGKEPTAVVVGTYRYKAIKDSYFIFNLLRQKDSGLKLIIIGDKKKIPKKIRQDINVIAIGVVSQSEVINYLRRTKYYISTTCIENSYNAASEGIFFAEESFISDIGPHRELMTNMQFDSVFISKIKRHMLHVKKENISSKYLKTWSTVVSEMLEYVGMNPPRPVDR